MKFETGDKVYCKYETWGRGKIIGIVNSPILNNVMYCVEFDKDIKGHDGNNIFDSFTKKIIIGKHSHCWWVYKDDLELIQKHNINRRIIC